MLFNALIKKPLHFEITNLFLIFDNFPNNWFLLLALGLYVTQPTASLEKVGGVSELAGTKTVKDTWTRNFQGRSCEELEPGCHYKKMKNDFN